MTFSTPADPSVAPLIEPREQTSGQVTDRIATIPMQHFGFGFLAALGFTSALVMMLLTSIAYLIFRGIGIWGINIPVAWGFAIINFVWWIGIGHAGTLISAILLLLKQKWRNSINRFAEAMTLFAVMMAGLFPLLHLGRLQRFYYILPYPSVLGAWPQWRSPLTWDVVAVSTYFTVSLIFWYIGLIPDLASMRDLAKGKWMRRIAAIGALGWRGSAKHWQRHQMLYLLLAGLATPLVVSVHSIVSLDFAVAMVPGWHTTIFPPYFVAGAIFSGFAMVITIAVPLRPIFGFEDLITQRHLNAMAKIMLVTGLVVAYGYLMEDFMAWFSGDKYEIYMAWIRKIGPYWPVFWLTMLCNVLAPQLLWFRWFRVNPWPLFFVAQFVNVGMWVERYMIVVTSLNRDFMPSAWGIYHGTIWDWMTFVGTLGTFAFLILLFIRFCPMISISEIRELMHQSNERAREEDQPRPFNREDYQKEDQGRPHRDTEAGFDAEHAPAMPLRDEMLYGLAAEFKTPEALLAAARGVRETGYRRMEAYSPFPLEDMPEAMGRGRTWVPLIVLIGGLFGACSAYGLMYWTAVINYPWDIGGRPHHAWPSFIPITFEFAVLCGTLFGFFGLLILNKLPRLYHPVFNARGFERVSRDRFMICIEHTDPHFDRDKTRSLLESLDPIQVCEVAK